MAFFVIPVFVLLTVGKKCILLIRELGSLFGCFLLLVDEIGSILVIFVVFLIILLFLFVVVEIIEIIRGIIGYNILFLGLFWWGIIRGHASKLGFGYDSLAE